VAIKDWWPFNLASPSSTRTVGNQPIAGVAAQEYGVSGTENFGGYIRKEDYNPDFDDWQKAVPIYDKMRRTDSMVRAMLQVIKLPLRGATWQCNPASDDPVDKKIADFCTNAIFDDDALEDSWDYVLRHILLMLDFGVSVLEKVWMVDPEGNYRFKRLAPRLPKTLREWHVNREGKLVALVQYAPVTHYTDRNDQGFQRVPRYGQSVSYQYLTIPADYLSVFCLDREGDNFQGNGLLRNIYRNWWFKDQAYHIMGVGLDRWGVGIPIAQLEEGHNLTAGDQEKLREILQQIRVNEKAFMVMPEHVKFLIEPTRGASGTEGQFGIAWIDHNDSQIARNVLASFLTMGRDPVGTLGFGSRLTDMFISSLNGIAKGISGDIKKQLVKPLCDFNFDMSNRQYPEPVCLDLEQIDLDALINVMAKLEGTVLTPQDDDEVVLRKILGLPPLKGSSKGKRGGSPQPPGGAPGGGAPPPPGHPGQPGVPAPPHPNAQGVTPPAHPFGAPPNPDAAHPFGSAEGIPHVMMRADDPPLKAGETADTPPAPATSDEGTVLPADANTTGVPTTSATAAGDTGKPAPAPSAPPADLAPDKPRAPGATAARGEAAQGATTAQIQSLQTAYDAMSPSEQAALNTGYSTAQTAGFDGSKQDFLVEQAALYRFAKDGDPRLKTWFSTKTLQALDASAARTLIDVAQTRLQDAATGDKAAKPPVLPTSGPVPPAPVATPATLDDPPEPTPETSSGYPTGATPDQGEALATAYDAMGAEEQELLTAGYANAQASGYTGTIGDFFIDQVALARFAPEGDARVQTLFNEDTLAALDAGPVKPLIDKAQARLQGGKA
jgi:hypothetical protein